MPNRRMLVKTSTLFLLVFCFGGCVSTPRATSMQTVNAVEFFGKNWSQFQGRLLKIDSKGNEFTASQVVRENALIRATWEAYQRGYEYFMILHEDSDVDHESHTTSGQATTWNNAYGGSHTTYTPGYTYNTDEYSFSIMILPCSENELFDNTPTFAVNSRLPQAKRYFDKTEKSTTPR